MKPTLGHIASGAHRQHPRYRGCISHWMLIEGGGTALYDVSGFSKEMTISGNPIWSQGLLTFDGVGDYCSRAIDNTYNTTQGSILTRVRREDATGGEAAVCGFGDGSVEGDTIAYIEWLDTSGILRVLVAAGGTNIWRGQTSDSFSIGNWYDLALTVDSSGNTLYVNGVQQVLSYDFGSAASTEWLSVPFAVLTTVDIGRLNTVNYPLYLTGSIEYVKIYDRGLTAAEVLSHVLAPYLEFQYKRAKTNFFIDTALVQASRRLLQGIGA